MIYEKFIKIIGTISDRAQAEKSKRTQKNIYI